MTTTLLAPGTAHATRYGAASPAGEPFTGSHLARSNVYAFGSAATIVARGNRFRLGAGTIVALGCFGQSQGSPLLPSLRLLRGTVHVDTNATAPGGVSTEEGLYGPPPGGAQKMSYTVTRKLTDRRTAGPNGIFAFFADFAGQPTGTTRSVANTATLNVTPYVGPQPGVCRVGHTSMLTTQGRFGKGTSTFS